MLENLIAWRAKTPTLGVVITLALFVAVGSAALL
jgi:hypothetical protein